MVSDKKGMVVVFESMFYGYEAKWTSKKTLGVLKETRGKVESFCCDKMEEFWRQEKFSYGTESYNNIERCVVVIVHNYYDNNGERIPIEICPFCGAKIVFKEGEHFVEDRIVSEKSKVTTCTEYKLRPMGEGE